MARLIFSRFAYLFTAWVVSQSIAFAQVSESRPAIPTPEEHKAILAQLDETLGLSNLKSKADREQAVTKLMEIVEQSGESPDDLYVSLKTVIPLIRETGDFAAHQIAVQKLTETFSAEPLKEQTQLLLEFISACKSKESLAPAVEELAGLADGEGQANQFAQPLAWLDAAEKMAKKLKDQSSVALIANTRASLTQRQAAFQAHEKAAQTLATNPEDPQANFAEGQWLAIYEDNWDRALPLLAKGSDDKWKAAAVAELAASEDAESQLKAADAWYAVAQSAGPGQALAQQHALDQYTQAAPNVTSPVTKARVTKRQEELTAALTPPADAASIVKKAPSTGKGKKVEKDDNVLPIGEPIDLLAMVKLPEHAVMGRWKREGDEVVCEPGFFSRVLTPVVIAGSYEVNASITRRSGNDCVHLILPVGYAACELCLDDYGSTISELQLVDGKSALHLLGTPAAVRHQQALTNGVKCEVSVIVTLNGDNVRIAATIDGVPTIAWTGLTSQLSMAPHQSIPASHSIGFLAHGSPVSFHSLTLRVNKGGRGYRLKDDWKNPLFVVDDKPSKEVAKAVRLTDWNGKKYLISEKPMSLPDVQRLATQVKGRLLTISSKEEEEYFYKQGSGLRFWMSGWCAVDRKWRDERNRPLRYQGKWAILLGRVQPDNANGVRIQLAIITAGLIGWDDLETNAGGIHACIEWGEEYPDNP